MEILLFLFIAAAAYLILCTVLRVPSRRTAKAAMDVTQHDTRKAHTLDAMVLSWASKLGRHIKLDDIRRRKMLHSLQFADVALIPETYIARAIIRAVIKLPLLVPAALIVPIISVPIVGVVIVDGLISDLHGSQKSAVKKREEINSELFRLSETIATELHHDRNVIRILEGYKPSAGPEFQKQLVITLADMKSGNQESALKRLEQRVGSPALSEVVRGLLAVLAGNDGVRIFEQMADKFSAVRYQLLEREAKKRPDKVSKWEMVLAMAIVATLLMAIWTSVQQSGGQLF